MGFSVEEAQALDWEIPCSNFVVYCYDVRHHHVHVLL
jgi:hypothetical protein